MAHFRAVLTEWFARLQSETAPLQAIREPANPRRLWSQKTDCSENGLGEPEHGSLMVPGRWQLCSQQRACGKGRRLTPLDDGGDDIGCHA